MNNYLELIHAIADEFGIERNHFEALCRVESSLIPTMVRFESGFKYSCFPRENADRLGISVNTEYTLQCMSFGLGQIMGGTAREEGFKGMLTELIADPEKGLRAAATHLKKMFERYETDMDAFSAYNQGSPRKTVGGMYENQQYVDKIAAALKTIAPV